MRKLNTIINLKEVNKTFDNGTVAIQGMNIDVSNGQFISFLGPSGCGKSTVLKMIAGLLKPTSGDIMFNGKSFSSQLQDLEIGYVFQDATLMPWATVSDNVFLPLRIRGISKSKASSEIEKVLMQVGLKDFFNAYPRELSGGMKMRVSIARALIMRPKLLLMDEPFAALDEMTRFKLNDDVLTFWGNGDLTVIFVTHSVFESVYLSNRVVVMAPRPGRVIADISLNNNYPRSKEYRTTTNYAKNCRLISKYLQNTI